MQGAAGSGPVIFEPEKECGTMNLSERSPKGGHPVLGIVLGVLGIIAALLLGLVTGVIAGGFALLLGVLAVILGAQARKTGRGMGAIITGIIAVMTAAVMTMSAVNIVGTLKQEALKNGSAPLIVQCADYPWLGLMGFIRSAAEKDADPEELGRQLNLLAQENPAAAQPAAAPQE